MSREFEDRALAILDRIGVSLVTAGGDDMRKLGEILTGIEELGKLASEAGRTDIPEAAAAADAIITAFIFRDDLKGRWEEGAELSSRLVSSCRESCAGGKSCSGEVRAVARIARERMGIEIEIGGRGREAAPGPVSGGRKAVPEAIPLDKDKDLYPDFVNEAKEHLDEIEVKLVDLEANPGDAETVNALFRAFHTIKGISGFLDLPDVNGLAHATEAILDMARKGELAVTSQAVDVVFEAVDALRSMVKDVAEKTAAGALSRQPRNAEGILSRLEAVKTGEAGPRRGTLPLGDVLVEQGKVSRKDVEEAVEEQARSSDGRPIGEILIEAKKVTPRAVAEALRVQMAGPSAEDSRYVRIDVQKLDSLVDTVGEMVIAQTLVYNDPGVRAIEDQVFYRNMAQLGRVTGDLQKISMSMRMVTVRSTFQKMSRLVRDLARKSGKEIVFATEGEETEIDRNMVEEIHDPLVHLVRNAVDHGIEPAAERTAAGKKPYGTVALRACHQGGSVVITAEDDGRGLDERKILERAVERGLVPAGTELQSAELLAMVFEAGFSTVDKVTEISGRGVGLDVVRKNVQKLRGTIEAKSRPGQGTSFIMTLPLTLAIIDAIVVSVGTQRYLVATHAVIEAARPEKRDFFTVEHQGELLSVRGELLPLVRLHSLFGVPGAVEDPMAGLVIVVESDGEKRAVLVDNLVGKQQVVIKGLGRGMEGARGVSGGAIMGDGRVGLILDVPGIVSMTSRKRACV